MARKNYAYERNQRAKAKVAKRQAKLAEKAARSRAGLGRADNDAQGGEPAAEQPPQVSGSEGDRA
jgi:hypothetical protein